MAAAIALAAAAFGQPIVLKLRVQPWTGYTLESSADLNQWSSGKQVFVTNSALEVVVTNSLMPVQFFRACEISNNDFTNRFRIEGFPSTVFGSDVNASREPGEPGLGFDQTVWWTWTAPVSSTVGICYAGTDFPATMKVYTGNSLSNLVQVPFDAIYKGGIVFDAAAGTTYHLQFGPAPTYFGALPPPQGPLQFTLAPPPPNDDFCNRIVVAGADVVTNMPALLATSEPFETNGYGHSIWWSWTAPTNGNVSLVVDCQNYGFLPEIFAGRVNVFTGQATNDLIPVSLITTRPSAFHFDAVGNTTYQIAQDSYSAGNDSLQLQFSSNRYLVKAYAWPSGTGKVTLSPAPDSDGLYAAGTIITVTATSNEGYHFMGWRGSLTNTSASIQIISDRSYQVEAAFEQ